MENSRGDEQKAAPAKGGEQREREVEVTATLLSTYGSNPIELKEVVFQNTCERHEVIQKNTSVPPIANSRKQKVRVRGRHITGATVKKGVYNIHPKKVYYTN